MFSVYRYSDKKNKFNYFGCDLGVQSTHLKPACDGAAMKEFGNQD